MEDKDPQTDIEKFQMEKFAEEIKVIKDSLKEADTDSTARLEEYIFVNVFLPLFAGDTELMYPQASLAIWANIAGSVYKPVNIVNKNGEVLYTVPPIMNNTVINPISNSKTSLAHVVATAKQYSNIHPVQGRNYLMAELTQRATIMNVPKNVLENLHQWNEIFTRYGRPKIAEEQPVSEKNGDGLADYDFE